MGKKPRAKNDVVSADQIRASLFEMAPELQQIGGALKLLAILGEAGDSVEPIALAALARAGESAFERLFTLWQVCGDQGLTMPRRHRKWRPAIELAGLTDLEPGELRRLWTEAYGIEPLPRISRELLVRAIAYRMQEEKEGSLSRRAARELDHSAAAFGQPENAAAGMPPISPRPGTRLVREWRGTVHEVIVLEDDYLWLEKRYRSLSEIARQITGARWSGPRFFGIRPTNAKRQGRAKGAISHV